MSTEQPTQPTIKPVVMEHGRNTGILWDTLLVFSELKKQGYVKNLTFDTFVATRCIQNNITPKKVILFSQKKLKHTFTNRTIKKQLKDLCMLGYLKEGNYGYDVCNEFKCTREHFRFRNISLNHKTIQSFDTTGFVLHYDHPFTDSKKDIVEYDEEGNYLTNTFKEYQNSNFNSFYHFLFSELIIRYWFGVAPTQSQIQNLLGISGEDIKHINKGFYSRNNYERHTIKSYTFTGSEERDNKDYIRQITHDKSFYHMPINEHAYKEKHLIKIADQNTAYENRARSIITTGCYYQKTIWATSVRVPRSMWQTDDTRKHTLRLWPEAFGYTTITEIQDYSTKSDTKEEFLNNLTTEPKSRVEERFLPQWARVDDNYFPGSRIIRDLNLDKDLGMKYWEWMQDNLIKKQHCERLCQESFLDHVEKYLYALQKTRYTDNERKDQSFSGSKNLFRYSFGFPTPNLFNFFCSSLENPLVPRPDVNYALWKIMRLVNG